MTDDTPWPTVEDLVERIYGVRSRAMARAEAAKILALFEPLRAELEALRPVARALPVLVEAVEKFKELWEFTEGPLIGDRLRWYSEAREHLIGAALIGARSVIDAMDPDLRARLLEGA